MNLISVINTVLYLISLNIRLDRRLHVYVMSILKIVPRSNHVDADLKIVKCTCMT